MGLHHLQTGQILIHRALALLLNLVVLAGCPMLSRVFYHRLFFPGSPTLEKGTSLIETSLLDKRGGLYIRVLPGQ
jgi:hypothetical protein